MKLRKSKFWFVNFSTLCCLLSSLPTVAQIAPDATLPVNSLVTVNGNVSIITGGTRAGSNLFHSFEQFSVPTGGAAFFNNAPDIQNIVSRVTGLSASNIDGLIRANGAANLFLLNPNGIILGPNARLDIGGSFVASTASSLNFADGTQLSATAHPTTPLLTVSVPLGLQFGSNPGRIQVQGNGHSLANPIFSPITGFNSLIGLRVQPGKTLALVGGDVALDGGVLTAEGGRIELGSVASGSVNFRPTTPGFSLVYQGVSDFKDIQLSKQALLDASGAVGGEIAVQGKLVSLSAGSAILIQNKGSQPSGSINVNASDSLEVNGTFPDGRIASTLLTEAVGTGSGGDITVSAKKVIVQNGGQILPRTFSPANGGNLIVNAPNSVRLIGFSPAYPNLFSNISAATFGFGDAGNLKILTGRLTLKNGANVGSATFGKGAGGDVIVEATDFVELSGVTPILSTPTALTSAAFNAGDAGSLTINTSKLAVGDGGVVSAGTVATGNAGSLTINASDSVEVRGVISSAASQWQNETLRQTFRAPLISEGASGDVTINTGRLGITNAGQVIVRNNGKGDAGTLRVNARSIVLDNFGSIAAAAASGQGGNIFLQAQNLLMRHNSQISAEAGGTGNGGNITINTPFIIAVPTENSDIIANAVRGQGGNINIKTQGIYGLEYRSQPTRFSDINASSDFGINGTVQINTLDTDPSRALVTLPTQPVGATELIAQGCPGTVGPRGSKFVVTGRGGIPEDPNERLSSERVWTDSHLIAPIENQPSSPRPTQPTDSVAAPLVEATGWTTNSKGEVILTAAAPSATLQVPWLTSTSCHAS